MAKDTKIYDSAFVGPNVTIGNQGGGVKPRDIFYLHWILERNSEQIGYGHDAMEKVVYLKKGML